jgi:hypothetical protein
MILIVLIIIRGPAEKQIMEPEEAVTEPDDEVYGCLSSEDSPHMSDEDKELQRLINEKKRTGHTGLDTLRDLKNRSVNGITKNILFSISMAVSWRVWRLQRNKKHAH